MSGFRFAGAADYARAYRDGLTTPRQVARRVLEATAASEGLDPPMRIFIAQRAEDLLQQAQQSSDRYERGRPLGPLDGVPVAVKDEVDQIGYPSTVGTSFLGGEPLARDAEVVARLRAAGALLIGKANMHEIGLGMTGINPHHGSARNPFNPGHVTGGSSSGSAAAVASGLCPVAVGADGGGSIRVPAAFCGVVGLKATFGRVSEVGASPLCWSVAHVGPLAASVADAAAGLELMAGPDPADPNTLGQPPLSLGDLEAGVRGLRVGLCRDWWSEARPEVLKVCEQAVGRLEAAGAELREVQIEHLDRVRMVQFITIGVEMAASQYEHRREHRRDYNADTRLLLELASNVPAVDYVRAQRLRTLIARAFGGALQQVDLLATPMVAITAPPLPPDAELAGASDQDLLEQLSAFSFAANLTGLPALSVPAGFDADGLPVGLQLMGRHWQEATLLRAGRALEQVTEGQKPQVHYRLLP